MNHQSQSRLWLSGILSLGLLGGGFFYFLQTHPDFILKTQETMSQVSLPFLALGLGLALAQVVCQISRLYFLARPLGLDFFSISFAFSIGQWINQFIPARTGDVVKGYHLTQKLGSSSAQTAIAQATAVLLADKLIDALSFFFIIAAVIVFYPLSGQPLPLLSISRFSPSLSSSLPWILLLGGGVILVLGVFFQKRKAKWTFFLSTLIKNFGHLKNPKLTVPSLVVSLGSWLFEALIICFLASHLGQNLTFHQALSVLVILNLGIAIPVTVANLGAFEASMVFALSQWQVPTEVGFVIALVHHGLQITAISLASLVCVVAKSRRTLRLK